MGVSGEKFAEAQSLRRMMRAHQNDIPVTAPEQKNASENESTHQDFVEFGIPCQQLLQLWSSQFDELSSFRNPPTSHPGPIRDCNHLASKCSGVKRHEDTFSTDSVVQNNIQASRKQNPEGCIRQARLEQNLAKQDLAYPARLAKPRDLRSGQ